MSSNRPSNVAVTWWRRCSRCTILKHQDLTDKLTASSDGRPCDGYDPLVSLAISSISQAGVRFCTAFGTAHSDTGTNGFSPPDMFPGGPNPPYTLTVFGSINDTPVPARLKCKPGFRVNTTTCRCENINSTSTQSSIPIPPAGQALAGPQVPLSCREEFPNAPYKPGDPCYGVIIPSTPGQLLNV
jgi:hypothetical protein